MSTVSPPSRAALLRELAAMFLDDQIDGTLAVALANYADDGYIDLSVRPLPSIDPVGALYGFRAPDDWVAFGIVTSGAAHHLDDDDAAPFDVRVVYFLDRRGLEVSLAKAGRNGTPVVVDVIGPPSVLGRVPDACRRVLGLPTAPPDRDPQLLWAIDWLDRILTAVLDRELDAPPLPWSTIEQLHRGRPSDSAPWSILRRECAAGELDLVSLPADDAEWMDDGMFSRQALAAYLDLREVVVDLAELLPAETWHKIVARLHVDHIF
ncbi:MAG: hypothetical protein ABIQ73_27625 [Acidimicrobiales bacterium]